MEHLHGEGETLVEGVHGRRGPEQGGPGLSALLRRRARGNLPAAQTTCEGKLAGHHLWDFPVVLPDRSWPWVTETTASKAVDEGGCCVGVRVC